MGESLIRTRTAYTTGVFDGSDVGFGAVMGALLYLVHPKALELDADAISHATSFVAVALMISLFMERALEVFVGVWRNPDLVALEAELERIAQWLTDASKSAERAALLDQQSLLSRRRIRYKGETQTFALRASFFAGLLISVAGLRRAAADGVARMSAVRPRLPAGGR